MTDSNCEQHPLLYEDLSEDEKLSPRYQKRFRPMVFRGRSLNKVKGAAAIFKLWPGFWASSLTYWWIGLGMIAIVTLIIYNSVAAYALLPTEYFKNIRTRTSNNLKDTVLEENQGSQNVFMHLFVEYNKDIDLNSYMPYIEIIANKYPDYNYKLIIISNDTNIESNVISAEENNEIALNLLWANKNVQQTAKSNINIQHVTLTKYMENSPLGKYWRNLPHQFIEFLARAVSIWDKGGITFNPIILTPRSPHAVYIEKLQNILHNYPHISKKTPSDQKSTTNKVHHGFKKKVNNIRDIIDALENESVELSSTEQNLEEAEGKTDIFVTNSVKKSDNYSTNKQFNKLDQDVIINDTATKHVNEHYLSAVTKAHDMKEGFKKAALKNEHQLTSINNVTNNFSLLPMLLDFLFKNKPLAESSTYTSNDQPTISITRKRKHILTQNSKKNKTFPLKDKNVAENLKPVIIAASTIKEKFPNEDEIQFKQTDNNNQFTIDLKGNIIASVIPCHAFLGTIFSNLVHHSQESLTDFILTELSIFCKGVLSSCNGIDVILL